MSIIQRVSNETPPADAVLGNRTPLAAEALQAEAAAAASPGDPMSALRAALTRSDVTIDFASETHATPGGAGSSSYTSADLARAEYREALTNSLSLNSASTLSGMTLTQAVQNGVAMTAYYNSLLGMGVSQEQALQYTRQMNDGFVNTNYGASQHSSGSSGGSAPSLASLAPASQLSPGMNGGYYSPTFCSYSTSSSSDSGGDEDPVVLDLDGDGVELVARSASHAFYDLNGDGFLENVGWASGDDALLAIDLNGDGIINQTSEINFAHGVAGAATDLDGIRLTYDSNRDGVLDARDARFADFRVWHDVNADGVSDPSELRSLTEAGITSIGLTGSRVDENRDGNTIARYTHYTRADGTTGQVGDAGFSTSAFGYRFNPATGSLDLRAESLAAVASAGRGGTVTAADGTETLLVGDEGAETLRGGTGSDWLYGGDGADALSGGAGNDILFFDAADTIDGGDGFDIAIVTGEAGVTVDLGAVHVEGVAGGNGADRLTGTERAEYLGGGAGNDTLDGGAGNDTLVGGAGNDRLTGGAGADIIYGGSGNDTLDYSASAAGVAVNLATGLGAGGDAEGDMFRGVENLIGSAQADRLTGDDGANRLTGGAGADRLDGGAGDDTADYATSAEGVVVSLAGGWGLGGDAEGDRLTNIDNVTGSAHGDWLLGDGGVNVLNGGAGDDVLAGGGGTDTLLGGDGDDDILAGLDDRVDGGTGHDEVRLDGEGRGAVDRTWSNVEHVIGSDGGDRLWIGGGTDGSSTGPVLDGAGGADELGGSAGANTLDGGAGNDLLLGSGGDDTYAFGRGSGHDTVYDAFHQTFLGEGAAHVEASDRDAGNDTLRFGPGIAAGDLILLKAGDNLLVGLRQEGVAFDDLADRVIIRDFFRDNNRIESFRFADGSSATAEALGIGQYLTTAVDAGDHAAHTAEHANDGSGLLAEGAERIARLEPAGSAAALDAATAGAAGPGDEARWQAPASPEPRAAAGAEAPSAEERERLIERAAAIAASDQTPRWGVESPPESATAEVPAETSAPQRIWGVTPSPAAESVAETTPLAPETPAETNVPQRSWGVTPSVSSPSSEENDLPEGEDGTISWDRRRPRGSDVLLARMAAEAAELSTLTILGLTVAQAAAAQTIETADEVTHPGTAAVSSVTPPDTPDREDNSLLGPNAAPAPRGAEAVHAAALVEGEVLVPTIPPADDRPAPPVVEDGRPPVVLPDNETDVAAIAILAGPVAEVTADGGSGAAPTPPALPGFAAAMASTPLDGDWPGLRGGDGDDLFLIDKPEITPLSAIDGRSGTDTVVFSTDRGIVFDAGTRNIEVVKGGSGNDRFYPGEPVESGVRFRFEGGGGDDALWGGQNRDHLDGGLGRDVLAGMDGDDLLIGGQGADVLDGGSGTDRADYTGSAAGVSVDVAAGTGSGGDAEGDRLSGIEDLSGSAFGDDLRGDGGANALDGGEGDDLLTGGLGADRLDGGAGAHDRADYRRSGGGVWVDLAAGAGLYAEAHGDRLAGIEDLTGSAFGDELHGDDGANALDGGSGNDWLDGRDGDDTLYGGEGDDWLTGGLGADVLDGGSGIDRADYRDSAQGVTVDLVSGLGTGGDAEGDRLTGIEDLTGSAFGDELDGDGMANALDGGDGHDRLDGRDGADDLRGGAGDDLLIGGLGADRLDGGAGVDGADYSGSMGGVWVDLATGAGRYAEAEGDWLTGIENLTGSSHNDALFGDGGANALAGGAGDDLLSGRDGDDVINGGDGDDWLAGGQGADTLDGGAGIDVADYADSTQGVNVDLAMGAGTGGDAQGDRLTGIEDLSGSAFGDGLRGDGGANGLDGGSGDDELDGRGGADALHGGEGDDLLTGGLGADLLDGGDGAHDRADYRRSGGGVWVDLAAGAGLYAEAHGDRLVGVEDLTGSAFGDELHGDGGANALDGGSGNDRLDGRGGADILWGGEGDDLLIGGRGADVLDGGAGIDRADYRDSAQGVTVDLVSGTGSGGEAEGDRLTGIEDLAGSAFGDDLRGGDDANALDSGAGDDALDGREGDDTLLGGDGDDRLIGGLGADVLDGGAGIDRADYTGSDAGVYVDLALRFGAGGHAHGDVLLNIEDVEGSQHADTLLADQGTNRLWGGIGNDRLDGRGGDDRLSGGDGGDWLIGGLGADVLDGGAGVDTVDYSGSGSGVQADLALGRGSGGDAEGDRYSAIEDVVGSGWNDTIIGNALDNRLEGGEGDDGIIGGAGADWLDGGAGRDRTTYDASDAGVYVDLLAQAGSGGDAQGDRLVGVEDVTGSRHADTLLGDDADNTLIGLDGNDRLDGREGDDRLAGAGGSDTLFGGAGDDVLWGGDGADWLDGGGGFDAAVYDDASGGVWADLGAGRGIAGAAAGDTLVGIERLIGSRFNDTLVGGAEGDRLDGGLGDDVLMGNGGDDRLFGDDGNDQLWGGAGNDDLRGGNGSDIVNYAGNWNGYRIERGASGGVTITDARPDLNGDEGRDSLTGIEELRFADRTYYLDGRNNAPIALADGVVTDEDVSVVISAASLAANDTDFDGDPLTIGAVADAVHGTVWLDHGNVVFRPDAGYHGAASFTYRASDGRGGLSEGTTVSVRVNPVNDAPIAHNDSFRGAIATQDFRMSMSSLLANDSDPDGDTLRIASVGGCADGSVWLDGKDVVFRAKSHAVDGTITFTYTVTDDHGGNTSASASLQVSGFNNAPFTLEDDICLIPEGYYSSFGYIYDSDLLDNDYDLDGDKIKIRTLSLVDYNGIEYSAVRGPSGGIIVRGSGHATTWIVRYSIEDEYGAVSGIGESKVCVLLRKPPIVLDLDGDGIELVNVRDSSAHFDMDGDGSRDLTGWASADDGILVYDQNGDHQIDRHEEVVLSSWGTPGMTDLEGLAYAFDSNHDGVFDHRDAEWSRFAVWQDRNQDGNGTSDEVRNLEEAGITAIHLQSDARAEDIAGNHVYGYAVYDTSDGGHGKVADAAFSYTPTPPADGGASPLTVAGPTAEGHAPVTGVSSVEGNAGDAPAGLPSGIASAGGEANQPDSPAVSPGHASSVPAVEGDDAGLHQLASMMAAFDAQAETMDTAPPIDADLPDALDLDHRIAA